MDIPTTIMYVWHACILSPHGHTYHHHVCMVCMHLITTWTYPLPSCMCGMMHHISTYTYPPPSCMYGMHASYHHMDIPTTIIYVWHSCIYLHMDIPTPIMYVWQACILSPHGHTHYHHVCVACLHLISTWTYLPPSCMYGMHASLLHMDIPTTLCMYGMHASYLHMDIPTTIMYMWNACILSPHVYTH